MRRLGASRWPLLLIVVVYLVWGLFYIERTSFVVGDERVYCLWDDAMISMRYARNLAEGRGLSWNGDEERVLGFTNPGVTLGMAALHLTSIPIPLLPQAVQLANLCILAGIVVVSWRLARRAFASDPPVPLVAAAIVASCAPLAIWGLQGSDVAAQTLVLLLALDAIVAREVQARPWPVAALYLLGAGVWIRPDGTVALVSVVLAGCLLARNRGAVSVHGAIALVMAWAPLLALGLLYYGDPLPNTYYLKATGSPRALVWSSGLQQALWLLGSALPITLMCVICGPLLLGRQPWFWVLASVVGAQLVYHIQVGGDWQVDYVSRYLVPLLPIAAVLFTGIAWRLACHLRRWLPRFAAGALFGSLALIGAFALSPAAPREEWLSPSQPTMLWKFNRLLYHYGEYFRDHTAGDTLIAHHWAGVVPYVADRPAIDMLGRSDRHIAHLDVARFAPGHSKWDWDYVIDERRPDIIIGADRGLELHPGFLRLYSRAKTANNLVFYLREGSRSKVDDPGLIHPYEHDGSP